MNLLLLSNSSSEAGYLTYALPYIDAWAASQRGDGEAVFIPFAGVTRSWDDYEALVAQALQPLGLRVRSLHREPDPVEAANKAQLFIVGGGNTFALLRHMRQRQLLGAVAARMRSDAAAYLGWSAGANLACPTVCTTNDMPIVDPEGLDALGLVPFQINPHYTEAHPPGHRGETRMQRLREFCTLHPDVPVLALPEGTGLHVQGTAHTLLGDSPARLFVGQETPRPLQPGPLEHFL
ncbi:dipeptidase PepE [Polaromonas sp. UC242_47]|uniref:dipeptidase PepE n=1 Tax=Polaromonas sp. UC242_47 TaxID=3374626 RepID=UPI0037BB26C0